ncbi:hypothetical protein Rpal_3355 [Rhodopseudomonas palustris TIE-1]|uniref:HI1506-related protein n=1 Tax=Rhodopseudomonas palustris TaxID=1076 RepID=UPI0001779757|nr:HI1506-related protein [Rhodopseudomonas palustris]ACF01857.1 hypothetical protein Rpal_3355 [Rhodopseudomonas palustris TIE-1]
MASKPKPKPKPEKPAEVADNSTPRTADQDHDQPAADAAAAADQAAAPAAGSVAEPAATTVTKANESFFVTTAVADQVAGVVVTQKIPTVDLVGELTKVVIVKSKSDRGRRRAGFAFTREETRIPLADLSDDQLVALVADTELIVETVDEVTAG